jgi:branched-chain amino acid transport system substrate-binding protein
VAADDCFGPRRAAKPACLSAKTLARDWGELAMRGIGPLTLLIGVSLALVMGTSTDIYAQTTGALINGLVNNEFYLPAASLQFAGTKEFLDAYQKRAPSLGIDPLGFTYPPYAYAAGQILAKAVSETKSLDDERLAEYIRGHAIDTVIGPMSFGEDGEWKAPRIIYAQFQNVSGNDIGQFKDMSRQIVVWPAQLKTGELIYPYAQALK